MVNCLRHFPYFLAAALAQYVFAFTLGKVSAFNRAKLTVTHFFMAGFYIKFFCANFTFYIRHVLTLSKKYVMVKHGTVD